MKKGAKWKIIFLDVDGVINTGRLRFNEFDPICLNHLKQIIDMTGAKIVVSSSWRRGNLEKTKLQFPEWMHEHIIGETINKYDSVVKGLQIVRGNEIYTWEYNNMTYPWHAYPELDNEYREHREDGTFQKMCSNRLNRDYTYVIIDDDIDMLYSQRNNFVNTDPEVGITKRDRNKAVKILNKI